MGRMQWPRGRVAEVPAPDMEWIQVDRPEMQRSVRSGQVPAEAAGKLIRLAAIVGGYPLFLRTDLCAAKHAWRQTCCVETERDLLPNTQRVLAANEDAEVTGLPYRAVVLRRYVEPDTRMWTRSGLPIGPQRTYFVREGAVVCDHGYWGEEAVEAFDGLPPDWRGRLVEMNRVTETEHQVLTGYAERLARELCQEPGEAWSLDFMRTRAGGWLWINADRAELRRHPQCDAWAGAGVAAGG